MSGSSSFAMMLEPWASIMTHAGALDKTAKEAHGIPVFRPEVNRIMSHKQTLHDFHEF